MPTSDRDRPSRRLRESMYGASATLLAEVAVVATFALLALLIALVISWIV